MTLTPSMIYLVHLVGELRWLANFSIFASLAVAAGAVFNASAIRDRHDCDEPRNVLRVKKLFRAAKIAAFVAVFVGVVSVVIPSRTTLAAMYVLPPIVNSELVQDLPKELVDLARAYVKELVEEKRK